METTAMTTENAALGGDVLLALAAIDRAAAERADASHGDAIAPAPRHQDVLAIASTLHTIYDRPGTTVAHAARRAHVLEMASTLHLLYDANGAALRLAAPRR